MIYNLLDFRLIVSDANPTLGGDGVFALWALRACSYKPKGETTHQGLSKERHSIRRKQTLTFGRACSRSAVLKQVWHCSRLNAAFCVRLKSVQIIHKISWRDAKGEITFNH